MLRTNEDHRHRTDVLKVHAVVSCTAGKSQDGQLQCFTAALQLLLQLFIAHCRRQLLFYGSFTLQKDESIKYGLNKLFSCQIYSFLYSYFKVLCGIIYIGR